MGSEEQKLLDLAGEIADGRPIDWDRERTTDPDLADSVDAFRLLEGVVVAHAAMPDAPSLPPGSTWGPLRILERIGTGTYGEVYRAFDPTLHREIALKLLHSSRCASPSELRRFLDEARRLASVRHDHVLTVHGADVHEGRAGMWTDLIRGDTLEELLASKGPMSAHEAALVGIDLCRALAALHASDLIHRDVKTHNVMRQQKGRIVLMDFGSVGEIAAPVPEGEDGGASGETLRSTPLTAAPELLRSEPATRASDIYSLGVLLYRLSTSAYPYEAADVGELMEKHAAGSGRPLREARPDLPVDFVQVVERAMEIDQALRYPGCGAMERALLACLGSETTVAPAAALATASPGPVPGAGSSSTPVRSHGGGMKWAAVAVGAAALAVVVSVIAIQQSREGDRERLAFTSSPPAPDQREEPSPGAGAQALPPVAAPGPVSSAPSLTATATLFRQNDGNGEPLPQNARVTSGDALFLELEGSEPMNVYVLNEDADGRLYVLFPLSGFDQANPLPGGARHRLPGTRGGAIENWEVSSAGGSEDLLVIASRRPIDGLERELARVPRASLDAPFEYPEVSRETVTKLRGIGRLRRQDAGPQEERPGRLSDILTGITRSPRSNVRDLWMWQTRLYNPATSP